MSRMQRGLFITTEGTDGSGKSSVSSALVKKIQEIKLDVQKTREPGGTEVGEIIRKALFDCHGMSMLAELKLLLFARKENVDYIIRPSLKENKIVICDRFSDSSLVFQSYLGGLPLSLVENLNESVCQEIKPDLTLVFLTDFKEAQKRMLNRVDGGKYDSLNEDEFLIVRDAYLDIARKNPDRVKIIYANQPLESVINTAWSVVYDKISSHSSFSS